MTERSLSDDRELGEEIARVAGRTLRLARAAYAGDDALELAAIGDASAERAIHEILSARRPSDSILSEEQGDDPQRLESERVWIVDPLDGTREYSEFRADWAVHVALWEKGQLAVGVVAIPDEDLVLSAGRETVPEHREGPIRIAVSRSRPPAMLPMLIESLDAVGVPMGSAGVKIAAIIRGHVDAYVHSGGQYEWDSAAPVALARAAGLHASRLDGSPLVYNQANPYLPDLLVCRPEIRETMFEAIRALSGESSV